MIDVLLFVKGLVKVTEKLSTDDVNIYTNSTLRKLDKRVTRLEQKEQNKEKDKLEWALNQFRYKKKTEDERKAFCIIESTLNTKW